MVVLMRIPSGKSVGVWLLMAGMAAQLGNRQATATGRTRAAQDRRVVRMVAERFSFRPSRVRMQLGEALELHIRSEDTSHGLKILGSGLDVRVPKRGRGEVILLFEPAEAGMYRFECSRLCGAGHNFMRGGILVEEPSDP
jgi:heme/copper-type cytochrome/quinol oxidase subunit 2